MSGVGARDGSTRRLRGRAPPRTTRAAMLAQWERRRAEARAIYEREKSYRATGKRLGVSRQRAWQMVNQPTKGAARG